MKSSILEYLVEQIMDEIELGEVYESRAYQQEKLYNRLSAMLNDEQKKLLLEFYDMSTGVKCSASEARFMAGVKVGVRLIVECLCG